MEVLRFHRGGNKSPAEKDSTIRVYQRLTAVPHGPQNCVPKWARDGAHMTLEDVVADLRKLREEVLTP